MAMIAKRKIKAFPLEGEAVDGETILRLRAEIEDRIIEDMREKGYVPIVDLLPQLYWEFDKETTNFKYIIIVYGTYIGKKASKEVMGILDGKMMYFES